MKKIHQGPLLLTLNNFDPSMDRYSMLSKVWDKITYHFPNFNCCTIDVCEWISDFTQSLQWMYISYPMMVRLCFSLKSVFHIDLVYLLLHIWRLTWTFCVMFSICEICPYGTQYQIIILTPQPLRALGYCRTPSRWAGVRQGRQAPLTLSRPKFFTDHFQT